MVLANVIMLTFYAKFYKRKFTNIVSFINMLDLITKGKWLANVLTFN